MRIAFHAPRASYFDPKHLTGGDPVFVNNLLEAFRRRGHEVLTVSNIDARDFWRGRLGALQLPREAFAVRRRVRSFSPDAWLIYTPSVFYPDLFGWWLRPKRYVLLAADTGDPARLPWAVRALFSWAHRRSLRRADVVAVHRPRSAKRVAAAGVKKDRIRILPMAPRAWEKVPSREEARQRLGLPDDRVIALTLCRFPRPGKKKHGKTETAIQVLQALAALPEEVHAVLVGDDGSGQQLVEREIRELHLEHRARIIGLSERLRLVGSGDNEDVKWFYAACDFYAYPHALDRPWLSIMEAQACGRPVVVMDNDSMRRIVDAGRTGLLASNLDEFREHMAALARDRRRCDEMGRRAREYIERRHSMESQVDQLEEMLGG